MELQSPSTSDIRLIKAGRAQVVAAAEEILRGGRRPTIDAIQGMLGGGSPNGIVAYLKEWYAELGERLARAEKPPEGLHPEVHRAALALQRAISRNKPDDAATEGTEALIRSLRAEVSSLQLLLDELRAQRGRDMQTLADARALLIRKDDLLQDLQAAQGKALARVAVLGQRLQARPLRVRNARPKRAAKIKTVAPRLGSNKNKRQTAAARRATRPKTPARRALRRR